MIMRALRSKTSIRILSDDSLTKKAYLNALASALDYFARFLVAFIVTPWMVAGLGDFYYGAWQILNRVVGFLAPTSGRPDQVLKSTIANQQTSTDNELKRSFVGVTLLIWVFFLPIMGIVGGAITWFVPLWMHTPSEYIVIIRATTALLVINLATTSVSALPQSVLEGENQGYKRIGLSVLLVFIGGGFTWLALAMGTGIIGVGTVALINTFLSGLLYLTIARKYVPWFGVARPSIEQTRQLLSLSWWFLSWNTIINLIISSDIILLGFLQSVESVTAYQLTKYAPETLISIVAIMFFGIIPGLGGIIGSGNSIKAANIRGELMAITWIIVTVMGGSIIIWNRPFIELWVGKDYFAGALPTLLIVVLIIQYVFIRNDSYIIDLTLRLRAKVFVGAISVVLSLISAGVLVKYFNLGVVGLCIGIIAGRSIMSLGFPIIIGRYLEVPITSQLKGILRPALVTLLIFQVSFWLGNQIPGITLIGFKGWVLFILEISVSFGILLCLIVFIGLTTYQRKKIKQRIHSLFVKV